MMKRVSPSERGFLRGGQSVEINETLCREFHPQVTLVTQLLNSNLINSPDAPVFPRDLQHAFPRLRAGLSTVCTEYIEVRALRRSLLCNENAHLQYKQNHELGNHPKDTETTGTSFLSQHLAPRLALTAIHTNSSNQFIDRVLTVR
jgi:hypothetical protein